MEVTFKKGALFSSQEFNKRFSDIFGSNVLKGFYLRKGQGDFDVLIGSGIDDENLLITDSGVRMREKGISIHQLPIEKNTGTGIRIDGVYLRYDNSQTGNQHSYVVQKGLPGGALPFGLDKALFTLLGYVIVPTDSAALTTDGFDHPARGAKIGRIAGDVEFTGKVDLNAGAVAMEPSADDGVANKGYVDRVTEELAMLLPLDRLQFTRSQLDAANGVYLKTEYTRPDGTRYMVSQLSQKNAAGKYERATNIFYEETGTNELRREVWNSVYDANGNVTSKQLI